MLRVNFDDLDAGRVPSAYYWQGKPFTGLAFEIANGQIVGEYEMKNGDFSGSFREWFLSGKLKAEGYETADNQNNWRREWYENGKLKYECVYDENGICAEENTWHE